MTKKMKLATKHQSIEKEGDPGQFRWKVSITEDGHLREVWMKTNPNTGDGLGQNLWK